MKSQNEVSLSKILDLLDRSITCSIYARERLLRLSKYDDKKIEGETERG